MPASDLVRRLSDEVARDPASLAWLPLAELLAGEGDAEGALQAARAGAGRHPRSYPLHRLRAELASAAGAWDEAADAWARAGAIAPDTPARSAALQGHAFAFARLGRLEAADRLLDEAALAGGDAGRIAAARGRLQALRGGGAAAALLQDDDVAALRVRHDGTLAVVRLRADLQAHAADVVARELGGLADEASRAMRHLGLGPWDRIVVEGAAAHVAIAPACDGVVLAATPAAAPPGRLARLLSRALAALAPARGAP